MKAKQISSITTIPLPLNEVFDFFSKAENLNRITPPELHFKILSEIHVPMFAGQLIKYRIKLFGIPFYWKTEISEWSPPIKFVDRQLSGPYAIWHHEHRFREIEGKTEMTDTVTYLSKGWILAPIIHLLFVDTKVKEIFAFREKKLHEIFGRN